MRAENNSSNKIFIVIIALLLIANIGTIAMLLSSKKTEAEEHHSFMRAFVKSDLKFSDKQLQDFDSIRSDYKAQAKQLLSKLQDDKQANLKQLSGADFSDSLLSAAATAVAADQQTVELNMLRHLRLIRSLCTPQQRAIFDTGFYRVMAKAADAKKKEK